jgi:hypothetical protein
MMPRNGEAAPTVAVMCPDAAVEEGIIFRPDGKNTA